MQLKSGHRHALCRDGDVLLGLTAGDDPQRIVRQRPLQRLRLILMSALRSLATDRLWRKAAIRSLGRVGGSGDLRGPSDNLGMT